MNDYGLYDIGSGTVWFALGGGWLAGVLTTVLLYVPYRNYRLNRMMQEADLEASRITAGFHIGRHAAVTDLADAAGALVAAKEANGSQVIYPGPHRHPEPAWVAWVEEHGKYHPVRPREDSPEHRDRPIPRHVKALFLVGFITLAAAWRAGQWFQRAADATWRGTEAPRYAYQLLWAIGVSVVHHVPRPSVQSWSQAHHKRRYHVVVR
jgi:hypothetical protein